MGCIVTILAAGKGTRMRSDRPKVLHEASGRALLDHVLDLAGQITERDRIVVVVGHGAAEVRRHIDHRGVRTALQEPQLGTGDALRVALGAAGTGDPVLVLSGDVPLLRRSCLDDLLAAVFGGAEAALLTARVDPPGAYGRVLRDSEGRVRAVVEAKDADPATLAVTEVNAGVYAFRRPSLERALVDLSPDNAQGEYYLTDVIRWLTDRDLPVAAAVLEDSDDMQGVNTREDLARVEALLQARETGRSRRNSG